jgi:hypothetical protein
VPAAAALTAPIWLVAAAALGSTAGEPVALVPSSEQVHTTEADGFALSAGIGNQYAMLGIQAAYYLQIPHSLYRIVGYLAAGWNFCSRADPWHCNLSAGVLASWGHKQRVYLGLGYATLSSFALSMHGEEGVSHTSAGPHLSLGFEYMNFSGFLMRTDLGVGYVLNPGLWSPSERVDWTFTLLGLGHKF